MWLYCVRHGESVHNAEGRIQGQADIPLSDFGRRQGEAIAAALAELPIDAIYASPLLRALETAQIVARRLNLPIRIDPRLKEIHIGVFQNRLRSEVAELYPEAFARWTAGEPDYAAAIIAHGRLLAVTLEAFVPVPAGPATPSLENASITTVRCDGDGCWELTAYNQVDHLRHVGLSGAGDL